MQTALLILNGYQVEKKLLKFLWEKNDFHLCTDGSYNYVKKLGFTPELTLGDFDSIKLDPKNNKNNSFLKLTDQNTTDSEKALDYLQQQQIKQVDIIGIVGSRLDHLLYNLRLLKIYNSFFTKLCYWSPSEVLELAKNKITIPAKVGTRISLFPFFDKVINLSSKGLKYEFKKNNLAFFELVSISNSIIKSPATLAWDSGYLAIFKEYN